MRRILQLHHAPVVRHDPRKIRQQLPTVKHVKHPLDGIQPLRQTMLLYAQTPSTLIPGKEHQPKRAKEQDPSRLMRRTTTSTD